MRSFNALDVTSRPRNEVKGRYANMWTRSSGGQSNKLVIVAWGKERIALKDLTDARSFRKNVSAYDATAEKKMMDDRMLEILTSRMLLDLSSSAKRALYQLS